MKDSCMIFVDILLLIGVVYLFSMCSSNSRRIYNDGNKTNASYNINHYIDTINGHIILITVCDDNYHQVSVSTLELKIK